MSNLRFLSFIYRTLIALLLFSSINHPVSADIKKIKVLILPFYDLHKKNMDMAIPDTLRAALVRDKSIEIVPFEIAQRTTRKIEPSLFWAERGEGWYGGGLIWEVKEEVLQETAVRLSTDYIIHGNISRFGDRWRVDAYIYAGGRKRPLWSFVSTGIQDNEIPENMDTMAKEISRWIHGELAVERAEEYIRGYMAGAHTYPATLKMVEGLVRDFPESIPLNAILMELYLKEKSRHKEAIIKTGLNIIDLYPSSSEDDARYLLSTGIDPFDVLAKIYEDGGLLKEAVATHEKALELYPYGTKHHRYGLGKDLYLFAVSLEKDGIIKEALDHYMRALEYLTPASEEYEPAKEGVTRLSTSIRR